MYLYLACALTHTCTCTHAHTCVHSYVHTSTKKTHTHTNTSAHTHTHTQTDTHTHTNTRARTERTRLAATLWCGIARQRNQPSSEHRLIQGEDDGLPPNTNHSLATPRSLTLRRKSKYNELLFVNFEQLQWLVWRYARTALLRAPAVENP